MSPETTASGSDPTTFDPLVGLVLQSIRRHEMLRPGERVLAGVSGGPDSMALLHVLQRTAGCLGIVLGVAHLDHGLRPESARSEALLVRQTAERFGLPFHAEKLEPLPKSGSLEEQLRELRYAFFARTVAAFHYDKLALGHHADDNAEAVLMHILRGSGRRGLSGIPPVRAGWIIRPLIEARHAQIMEYLRRQAVPFHQDPSNLDRRFARNRIRHHLLPLLQREYNPRLVESLNRTARLFREEEAWLERHLAPQLQELILRCDVDSLVLQAHGLSALPPAVGRLLVRMALRRWQGHLRRIGVRHVEAILALAASAQCKRLHLPLHLEVDRTDRQLRFRHLEAAPRRAPVPTEATVHYHYTFAGGDYPARLPIPEAGLTLLFSLIDPAETVQWQVPGQDVILLDLSQLSFPLAIRNFRPGDRLQPFGLQGSQKLKQLFCDRKIPRLQRRRLPLLISGGEILWVVGVRRAGRAALSPDSSAILRVEVEPPANAGQATEKSCETV